MDGVAAEEAGALAAGVVAADVLAADGLLDELEHAAASNAIGTTAVAVQTNRIILATSGHSFFTKCTLKRALLSRTLVRASKMTVARHGQESR
jgi:hypothetical protein